MRILLVVIGLAAIATVLWASWRVDRRLFIFTLVAILIGATLFGLGIWHSRETAMVNVPHDQVRLTLQRASGMEIGIRLQGRLHNESDYPLAVVRAMARVEQCVDEGACTLLGEETLTVRQHVPPGQSLPYSQMVQLSASLLDEPHDWQIEVKSVSGYANQGRRRH